MCTYFQSNEFKSQLFSGSACHFSETTKKEFASIFLWIPMKMSKKCNIWLVAYLIKSKTKINLEKALILAFSQKGKQYPKITPFFRVLFHSTNWQCPVLQTATGKNRWWSRCYYFYLENLCTFLLPTYLS